MKIIFLSHTAIGGDFVVGSHHLAQAMANDGNHVWHISAPITIGHFFNLKSRFIRSRIFRFINMGVVLNNVIDYVPFGFFPWVFVRGHKVLRNNLYLSKFFLNQAIRKLKIFNPDIIFIDEPRLIEALDCFESNIIVYRPTDLYGAIRNDKYIDNLERELISKSDLLVATSTPVKSHLEQLGANKVYVLENGVDYDFFSRPQELNKDIHLPDGFKAVYVGAIDDRFCFESILLSAKNNPNVSFIIIGPGYNNNFNETSNLTNIHWYGAISYDLLPAVLQKCHVALLPMTKIKSNAGRSPMKLYEYAAAGLPVIATTSQELENRKLPFVFLCDSPINFSQSICDYFNNKLSISSCDAKRIAEKNSWIEKSKWLLHMAGNINKSESVT